MNPPMKPVGEAEDMLIPASDEQVARLASIQAVRQLSDNVGRMARGVDTLISDVGQMKIDVALLKTHTETLRDLKVALEDHRGRLDALERLNAREEGQRTAVDWLTRNWTSLIAIVAAILALLGWRPRL